MQWNNRQLLCLPLAVFALLALVARAWNTQVKASHLAQANRPTANFLMRSASLYRMIAPQAGDIQMSQDIESAGMNARYVNCQDAQGNRLAHFIWNHNTGDLLTCTVLEGTPAGTLSHPLSPAEAETRARAWLQKLGVIVDASQWRRMAPVKQVWHAWVVRVQGEDKRASVILDSRTGMLRIMQAKPETMAFPTLKFAMLPPRY